MPKTQLIWSDRCQYLGLPWRRPGGRDEIASTISYGFDSLSAKPELRSPLPGDREVDVAIVGGDFTGLWTAYYLMRADPPCRVATIERETAGFGASGRNGGWCVPLIHGLHEFFESDPQSGTALREAIPVRRPFLTLSLYSTECASSDIANNAISFFYQRRSPR